MKRIFVLLIIILLPGCTMLGTYMDPQNPAPEYRVNGHVVKTNFVVLNPTWIEQNNVKPPAYHVGPYDILNIIVWNHPELTTITTQLSTPAQSGLLVSDQGTIAFPFAGTVKVAGLTLPQIEQLIGQKISKYIRNPQVTVRVAVFRSQEAQLLGELAGGQKTIPLSDKPTTLFDALNSVGGTSVTTANTTRIYVIRGSMEHLTVYSLNAKSPQTMMVAQLFNIRNNDIIYVSPLAITNWNRIISQVLPLFSATQTVQSTSELMKGY